MSLFTSNISLLVPAAAPLNTQYIEPSDGTTGNLVRFVGDSITFGFDASPSTNRWTTLLSVAKGWTEDNQGLSGYPLCSNPCISFIPKSLIPTKTASMRFMFIAAGNNDIQLTPGVTSDFFRTTLEDWVATSVSMGWNAHRIIIITPFYADFTAGSFPPCNTNSITTQRRLDFVQAAKDAAANSGAFCMDLYNPMKNTGGDAWLTPISGGPGIHPTTAGHAFIYSVMSAIMP